MPEVRPKRGCDLCGGVDDHPRHVLAVPPDYPGAIPTAEVVRIAIGNGANDEMVTALLAPDTVIRHMDCCATAGCAICAEMVAASGGAKGPKLLAHIIGGK